MQTIGAKVELQGEAQFKAGLQNIVQQSKTLAAELKNVSSSFDKNASAQDKARAKMDVLNRQIDTQKKYIDTLNQKYDSQKKRLQEIATEYEKVSAEQGENSKEAQKLATEYTRQDTAIEKTVETINKAETALHGMESELNATETELQEIEAAARGLTIGEKFEQEAQKIKAAGDKVKEFGTKVSDVGKGLSTKVTAPIVAVGAKGAQAFAEVDKTMALTNKTMGNTSAEAKVLNDAMKNAASNSTFGMSDAATATLNFARAGLDANQAAAALAPAMNLAAGEGGELDTVSSGLVATINGFHGSFEDAGHYADVFAAACNNSALDVDSLSSAMSIAAPIFSSAGYSIDDAALYMGVMANNGIEADKAANSLKTGIARLVSPAKDGAEMMEKLGISVTNSDGSMKDSVTVQKELHDAFSNLSESEQIAAASAIFGKNQMAPWLALINTAPGDVDALNTSLAECSGTTDEMANAMMTGFGGSMERLKSTLDVLVTTIGERLAPYILKVTEHIQSLADKFNALSPAQQETIIKIAGIVAAIGPLLVIIGKLTVGIGSVMTAAPKIVEGVEGVAKVFPKIGEAITKVGGVFKTIGSAIMAHPVIAIAAVLAGIGIALYELYKNNEDFRNKVNAIVDSLKEKWETFRTKFHEVVEAVKAKVEEWKQKFNDAKTAISTAIESTRAAVQTKLDSMKAAFETFKAKVTSAVNAVKTVFDNMKAGISSAIENAKSSIQSMLDKVNNVKNGIQTAINAIKGFFNNLKLKIPTPSLPKLPHFKLTTGSKNILGKEITYPTGFDVSWYDKGGIFRNPSIIGVGERRPEFVGALDDLRKIVREETSHGEISIVVNAAPGQDERAIADYVYNKLNSQLRRESLYA